MTERQSRHVHTSITLRDIEKLKEPRQTYLDILLFDEEEVKKHIEHSDPVAKVTFTRLEPKHKVYRPGSNETLFSSEEFAEYTEVVKYLYDLKSIGRAMCLGVGRYAHNHFRPLLGREKEEMDPYVSREHGLIFLNEKGNVCYHDIGTFKKGSTNGTKLNDASIIQDEILTWNEKDYFGLGETLTILKQGEPTIESKFKIRHQRS
tara:strand:- start:41 stop:655 length:615 start_codon:yes stop_codon:yes gene_type:complete